jgi:hypothetical protein
MIDSSLLSLQNEWRKNTKIAAKHDAWSAMGKAITDADKNLRSSVLGESSVLEQELNYIAYDRIELEDRAKAMKLQGVDEWHRKSYDAS